MGFVLDITVTRLRDGDSINFNIDSNTYTIDVINPQEQPATLQVRGTSDVIPTDNEFLTAVSRLENVINFSVKLLFIFSKNLNSSKSIYNGLQQQY